MIASAERENAWKTWGLRALGFIVMIIGSALIVSPVREIVSYLRWIPLVGGIRRGRRQPGRVIGCRHRERIHRVRRHRDELAGAQARAGVHAVCGERGVVRVGVGVGVAAERGGEGGGESGDRRRRRRRR